MTRKGANPKLPPEYKLDDRPPLSYLLVPVKRELSLPSCRHGGWPEILADQGWNKELSTNMVYEPLV